MVFVINQLGWVGISDKQLLSEHAERDPRTRKPHEIVVVLAHIGRHRCWIIPFGVNRAQYHPYLSLFCGAQLRVELCKLGHGEWADIWTVCEAEENQAPLAPEMLVAERLGVLILQSEADQVTGLRELGSTEFTHLGVRRLLSFCRFSEGVALRP